MNTSQVARIGAYELEVERDMIEVTSGLPTYRESWTHTDAAGHEHRYASGFPTLNEVVDASHWCDGTEGWAHHDPHEHVDESHYECKLCGEVIEPDTDPPYMPKWIPGTTRAYLEGPHPDGRWMRVWVTEHEAQVLIDEWSDEAAETLMAGLGDDRMIQATYSSH